MTYFDVLIVGAGHAGAQAAITLRQHGFKGTVAILGDEDCPPYERPPLSKDYLAGDKTFERILIRPNVFWHDNAIKLLLGKRVTKVDAQQKFVMADNEEIKFGYLIWSTGGTPRRLDCRGAHARNVHVVRRRSDVDGIRAQLDEIDRVTVIGGGYVGLETTAALARSGKHVVLLEAQSRVLARVAGEQLSHFFESEHRARGVDLRTGAAVEAIGVEDGRAVAVQLADGERIQTEMIIVGIGIAPETKPLTDAGASGANGVDVDGFGRTSLPEIYAIGDCAAHLNSFAGGSRIRLESVQNANDLARVAALHILGRNEPYHAIPWFWSHQYDLKLQTVGLSTDHDQTILRGDPADRSFSILYLKAGRLVALDCVNAARDYAQGRAQILSGALLNPLQLADPKISLREVEVVTPSNLQVPA